MPTGYTAGIIDGTTETFQDFVKQCMRAFGATIHMKEEGMDKVYEPRIPSDYNLKGLQKAKENRKQAEKLTDKELIKIRTKELKEKEKLYIENIAKIKANKDILQEFLKKAVEFIPPTPDHEELKKFMIEQLEITIERDGCSYYYEKELPFIRIELLSLDANKIRFSLIEEANKSISYHLKEHTEELKRCAGANAWVEVLLKSLD